MSRRTTRPQRSPLRLGLIAAALAIVLPAQAQSLKDLYEAARGYDATYQSARLAADAAGYRVDQARAGKRPQVDAVAAAGASDLNLGQDVRALRMTGGLEVQQALINPVTDRLIDQAAKGVDLARAQLQAAEQDLIVRVSQAYFDVLAATDSLDTVRASKRAISEQLASAKRNFEVGTATITDTREAQARFDLSRAQELAAENDLNVKKLALENLVGRAGIDAKRMALPVALPPLMPANVEEWVTQADNASPALQQLRLALDVARLETARAQAEGAYTVGWSASVDVGHVNTRASTAGGTFSNSDNGIDASIGVQLRMPLFTGGLIESRVKESTVLEEKARSDLDAARRNLQQATRSAYFGVESLRAQVAALEAAEASSQLALEATQLGYKVGVRVNLDVLNAQTQLYQARRDLAAARYNLLVNRLKLRQVAGVLQPNDVDAVNALLVR
jgi:outer membrane protein